MNKRRQVLFFAFISMLTNTGWSQAALTDSEVLDSLPTRRPTVKDLITGYMLAI